MNFVDRSLTCADCGHGFTFKTEDQAFHKEKGFTNDPRHCPFCRAARRVERNGGNSFGNSGSGGYAGEREFFNATCSGCGRDARVPFQPRGGKPVYCSDCFRSRQDSSSFGGASRGGGGGNRW